jgi:hypothetical protein
VQYVEQGKVSQLVIGAARHFADGTSITTAQPRGPVSESLGESQAWVLFVASWNKDLPSTSRSGNQNQK